MKTYKLQTMSNQLSRYAQEFDDGVPTGCFVNVDENQAYLKWLAEGNEPLPADEPSDV